MLQRLFIAGLVLVLLSPTIQAAEEQTNIDEEATHAQTRTIDIHQGKEDAHRVNAFCLNPKGEILAACGNGPGEIRVLNEQGELLNSWPISVKPEAINSTADGTILAGGEGKLFHFSADGKLLIEVDAPHAESLRNNTETIRKEAIAYIEQLKNQNSGGNLKMRIASYERMIEQLEKKGETEELSEQENQILKALPNALEVTKTQLAEQEEQESKKEQNGEEKVEDKGPSEEAIAAQVDSMIKDKMRIASISTDGESIYVATRALTGYGFAIWKMNQSMAEGVEIVTGLSGCCGQMDVQACKNGLYVAENSRKRVVCYDSAGKELKQWGKSDRTGIDGFTSCCNPMNVCFNKAGDVFTAESNTGRIKRFSADGEFMNFVGDVKLVPGCKNVSIAVTPDHSKVYMLDLTRNHIVVMEQRPEGSIKKVDRKEMTSRSNTTGNSWLSWWPTNKSK